MFWVYVLRNPQGKIYIGQSHDLSRRLRQHNDPNYRGTLHTNAGSFVAQGFDGIEVRGADGRNKAAEEAHEDQDGGGNGDGAKRDVKVDVAFAGGVVVERAVKR